MNINRSALAGLVVMLAAAAGSRGQEKLNLTVDQAVAVGLENSKSLHSSLMRVEAADARSSETNAARLPSLKVGGSYTRLSDVPAFVATIPQDAFGTGFPPQDVSFPLSQTILDNYNLRATVQQPLFTGFRLESSASLAARSADAAAQDYSRDRAELIYTVKSVYWGLFKAQESKKVIDQNVEQMKAHLNDVQNLFAQGIVTKNEVLKIEVQLSNAQVLQLDAENSVKLAMIGLNNVLGTPLSTEIVLASGIEEGAAGKEELQTFVDRAMGQRPELKGMEYRVEAGEAGVSLARSSWFPQIYLVGNYYYARPNQRIIPTLDQFRDTWDVSLSVSLDIWNWGTTIDQTHQAQAELAQAQDGLAQMKDGITLEVTQSYLQLKQSQERIAVAQKGVSQGEENYRITDEKFKSGLALNSDLLDAEVALLQAKWNYIQAVVDRQLAEARLQKATGEEPGSPAR